MVFITMPVKSILLVRNDNNHYILVGLDSISGQNKFFPWADPKVWHVLYADSVTCDSGVPALEDVTFTIEMLNPDSEGKPTNHCGCDETGKC